MNHLSAGLAIYGDRASELILTNYPPFFHFVLAILKGLGLEPVSAARGLNLILIAASSLLMGGVLKQQTQAAWPVVFLPGVFHLVFESSFSQSVFLRPDAWLLFFVSCSIYWASRAKGSPFWAACIASLATLTKQPGLVAPAIVVLMLVLKGDRTRVLSFSKWFLLINLGVWGALALSQGVAAIDSVWLSLLRGQTHEQELSRVWSLHTFAYQGRAWVGPLGVACALALGIWKRSWVWIVALLVDGAMLSRIAQIHAGDYFLWSQFLIMGGAIAHFFFVLFDWMLARPSRFVVAAGIALSLSAMGLQFWFYGRGLFKSGGQSQGQVWAAVEARHQQDMQEWVMRSEGARWASNRMGMALAQLGVRFDQEWCALQLEFGTERTDRGAAWVKRFERGDYPWVLWSDAFCLMSDPVEPVLKRCYQKQGSTQAIWLGAPRGLSILKYVGCTNS